MKQLIWLAFLLPFSALADNDTETFADCATQSTKEDCVHIAEADARLKLLEARIINLEALGNGASILNQLPVPHAKQNQNFTGPMEFVYEMSAFWSSDIFSCELLFRDILDFYRPVKEFNITTQQACNAWLESAIQNMGYSIVTLP